MGQITAWPNFMLDLPVGMGTHIPPVKVELWRELGVPWLAGMDLGVSPKMILHSFSGGRSMHNMSTGLKGKFGTSQRILDINATPCPPGTLAPSLIVVDIKSLIDLWDSSSASAILEDPLPEPSFPVVSSDSEWCCSTRAQ